MSERDRHSDDATALAAAKKISELITQDWMGGPVQRQAAIQIEIVRAIESTRIALSYQIPDERDSINRPLDDLAGPSNPTFDAGWNEYRRKALRKILEGTSTIQDPRLKPRYEGATSVRTSSPAADEEVPHTDPQP